MCNAANHPPGCRCGWGGPGHRGRGGGRSTALGLGWNPMSTWRGHAGLSSPNALCPICGRPVFFVRPERGGAVWFDSLGWPWPKHACMDNARIGTRLREPVQAPASRLSVHTAPGWTVNLGGISARWDDYWLCFRAVTGGGVFFGVPIMPPTPLSAVYLRWDSWPRSLGTIEYIASGASGPVVMSLPICSERLFRKAATRRRRRIDIFEWRCFSRWIKQVSRYTEKDTATFIAEIQDAIDLAGDGWSRSSESKDLVLERVRTICSKRSAFDSRQVLMWVRLFLG